MNCPICHSLNNEQVYKKLSQSITSDSELVNFPISNVICFDCGNVFNETGARNQVNKFYADDYKLHEETKKAEFKYFNDGKFVTHQDLRLEILENFFTPSNQGKILDIGCGKGNFLLSFSKKYKKWDLYGIEISKSAIEFANQILPQATFYEGFFNSKIFTEKFDLILAHGVLEHLESPNVFLDDMLSCLNDDGIIFIEVPNFKLNSADLFTYDHLTHFTKETLLNLFNLHGIEPIGLIESNERLPISIICKKTTNKKTIINHYTLLKKLTDEHIQINESIFQTYKKINDEFSKFGIFGLGEIGLAGIQHGKLDKEKIQFFFDENDLLVGTKKLGIEIKHLSDLSKYPDLPIALSVSPCYMKNIIKKLDKFNTNYLTPTGFEYYNSFFENSTIR